MASRPRSGRWEKRGTLSDKQPKAGESASASQGGNGRPVSVARRARGLLVLAAILAAALAGWFLVRPNPVPEPDAAFRLGGAAPKGTEGPSAQPRRPATEEVGLAEHQILAGNEAIADRLQSVEQLTKLLIRYEESTKYPPWSRPLDAEMADRVAWNKPVDNRRRFSDKPGEENTIELQFDRAHVMYGQALTATIECVAMGKEERVPVMIHAAQVTGASCKQAGVLTQVEFRDDGQGGDQAAGDYRYTARLVPAEVPAMRGPTCQTEMVVDVEAGGLRAPVSRAFTYAPRRIVEVLDVRDKAKDGNLVISLDAQVFERGYILIMANIVSAKAPREWVAFFEDSLELEAGRRVVDLTIFGKVLRDRGVDGPYVVRDIRGARVFTDGEEQDVWWAYDGTHETAAYRASQFSAEVWNSSEKQDKIDMYTDLIRQAQEREKM